MSKKSKPIDSLSPEEQEQTFERLNRAAVATIIDLLQNGSETTRLRASVWLLERKDKLSAPTESRVDYGEIRIGFDDDEE